MPTLTSAGVSVFVTDQSIYAQPNPTTIPLFVIATRANKPSPDGTGTALGTTESNRMRVISSQRELLQNYGNPIFVESDGAPVHGDETNEYALLATHSFMGLASRAFVLRADIDLGQLVPSNVEPVLPPPDNTYWIKSDSVIGGIFKLVAGVWTAQPFDVYTTAPGGSDGDNGDFSFDYSTLNGTIKFKIAGAWNAATTSNLTSLLGATNPLYASATTPVGAVDGDFWYKTSASSGGTDLKLSKYRAGDGVFVAQPINRNVSAPSPIAGVIWEDLSSIATTAARPLYVGTGATFIPLEVFVQTAAPVTNPDIGTLWFDDNILDFGMYVQDGSKTWKSIDTVTVTNPTNRQKVISQSPPVFPAFDAIWIDVSSPEDVDNFPVVKRWNGSTWIDISASMIIQSEDPVATLIADGSYWINTGESKTRNTVKEYDPDFIAYTVSSGVVVVEPGNHWRPASGKKFGRKAQRQMVVFGMAEVLVGNQQIRAEVNYYQLISAPGYPELYSEMLALNADNQEISFIVADPPKFMIPSGISQGREITASEWITNARNVASSGEDGFVGTPTPYAAIYYPWALGTNVTDGQNVLVPPSHVAMRTIAYSDSVAAPWFPPAGPSRGRADNVDSVGYLNNNGVYVPVQLTRSQRDILYEKKINPIADIPGQGLLVYGQKTLAASATALDRVNVARLILKMKYDLRRLLEPYLFEINDSVTRRSAQVVTERYLAGLKSLRALYDYAARCDESNNTSDRIDRNELWVDVAIKPAKAIEFIYVPIQVLGTGDQFPF